jgi:hypothetical protein
VKQYAPYKIGVTSPTPEWLSAQDIGEYFEEEDIKAIENCLQKLALLHQINQNKLEEEEEEVVLYDNRLSRGWRAKAVTKNGGLNRLLHQSTIVEFARRYQLFPEKLSTSNNYYCEDEEHFIHWCSALTSCKLA